MKVIHWSPVENKDSILENGIELKDTWVACSVLTPFVEMNRWWLDFVFKSEEYLGFIFDLSESDFPIVHSHWVCVKEHEYDDDYEILSTLRFDLAKIRKDNPDTVFDSLEEAKKGYRDNIFWRIGESIGDYKEIEDDNYLEAAYEHIKNNGSDLNRFLDDGSFIEFVFEDYQILIYNRIEPERIIKVIEANEKFVYNDLINEFKIEFGH